VRSSRICDSRQRQQQRSRTPYRRIRFCRRQMLVHPPDYRLGSQIFPRLLRTPCSCESKKTLLTEQGATIFSSTSKFDTKPFKIKRARRRKEARLATMNIFRFLGDMTHLLSIIVRGVHLTRGCNVHTPSMCANESSFVWNRCCS
jgi:hypothetical protein